MDTKMASWETKRDLTRAWIHVVSMRCTLTCIIAPH